MFSKNSLRNAGLAALLLAGFCGTAQAAISNNEIHLGFRMVGATGTQQDLVVNLGGIASSQLTTTGTIVNINADLVSVFGANWSTRSDVVFGAIGRDNTAGSFNLFAGSFGAGYVTTSPYTLAQLNNVANTNAGSIILGTAGTAAGVTLNQWDSSNSWSQQESGFGTNNNAFADTKANLTFALFESTTDFTGNASPKSFTLWNYAQGAPDFVQLNPGVTYALDSAGNISVVAAVPEPSTYGLMGAGALAAVAAVRRRRRNKVA